MSDRSTSGWEVLEANREAILDSWVKHVSRTLTGRMTQAELQRDVRRCSTRCWRPPPRTTSGSTRARRPAARLLADLARSRARQGFTATETAVSVFALKEAVLELSQRPGATLRLYRLLRDFSRLVDDLGLFTFETLRAGPRAGDLRAGRAAARAVHPGGQAVGRRRVAVPLVGTLDSARTQVVMEKLLQTLVDTGSRTRSSTSPACRRSTPRSPSTSSRPWWPPG